jgi:hypothetical protein
MLWTCGGNGVQSFLAISIKVLESIFAIGLLGSALVILLATFEDVHVLFEKEENPSSPEQ